MLFTLSYAAKSLRDRSLRSWLTITGVVISIAVILTLLTLTSSLQGAVLDLFQQFGANRLQIVAKGGVTGGDTAVPLLTTDVDYLKRLPYFSLVLPMLYDSSTPVSYRGHDLRLMTVGFDTSVAKATDQSYDYTSNMVEGRYFTDNERGVAILGNNVATNANDRYFGRSVPLRTTITVGNETLRVIGVFKKFGTSDDNTIFIPLSDARTIYGKPYDVSAVSVDVKPGLDIQTVADKTLRDLERRKGKDTVTVLTPQEIIRQFTTLTSTITAILLGIASISLIVGALGIANTMFTSVLEREPEIGILKSIGATNRAVLALFMAESGFIGLIGGAVGVALGMLLSLLVGQIAAASGFSLLKITFSVWQIAFSLAFAGLVGVASGFLPSYIASRKRIVETLRSS